MRHKPWAIKLMTTSLLLVPITAVGLVYFATKKNGIHFNTTIILDLWVLCAASVVAAFGVWRVRPWGFALFFIFVLGIIGVDLHHIIKNPASLNFWDLIDVSLVALGVIFILQKHVTAPYFNPKIRWWERPDRFKVDLTAIVVVSGQPIKTQILDVSESGCFIDTEAPLSLGDIISIDLVFNEFKFEASVKVVRQSKSPRGVGLMYMAPSIENKREIKRIIKVLRRDLKGKKNLPFQASA